MKQLYCIFLMLPALLLGQDWKWQQRAITLVDFFQTEQYVKVTPGVFERNPNLRGPTIDVALRMALECELIVLMIEKAPKDLRPVLSLAAALIRVQPVMNNARIGAPQPFYVPLITTRF